MRLTEKILAPYVGGRAKLGGLGYLYRSNIQDIRITRENCLWVIPSSTERWINGNYEPFVSSIIVMRLTSPIEEIGPDTMSMGMRLQIGEPPNVLVLYPPDKSN